MSLPEDGNSPPPASALPEYCCVILRDAAGDYCFETRPATARLAAGRATCFGGARQDQETPEECLRRELREELGIELEALRYCLRLVSGPRLIAWFYTATCPAKSTLSHREPGHGVVTVTKQQLTETLQNSIPLAGEAQISHWHVAALRAWLTGQPVAEVAG